MHSSDSKVPYLFIVYLLTFTLLLYLKKTCTSYREETIKFHIFFYNMYMRTFTLLLYLRNPITNSRRNYIPGQFRYLNKCTF